MLSQLPGAFPAPIVIVQHRPSVSESLLPQILARATPLRVVETFGPGTIGVVLSGTGSDGTDGVQAINQRGGIVIAQNEGTSKFFAMAASAIATGAVDYVLPLDEIAPMLRRLTHTEALNSHAEAV